MVKYLYTLFTLFLYFSSMDKLAIIGDGVSGNVGSFRTETIETNPCAWKVVLTDEHNGLGLIFVVAIIIIPFVIIRLLFATY